MPKNRHLFLDNKSNKNNKFKKTRYVPTPQATEETDVEQSKLPSIKQQARLKISLSDFRQDKVFREASRSIDVHAHIDLIKIHFYKVFNKELEKVFFEKYDLLVVTYENFNKTVLFEIRGGQPFDLFIQHLEAFFNSPTQETYQGKAYSLIALIHDFEFLSTTQRVHSNNQKISGLNLIPIQTASSGQIYRSLIQYLQDKQKEFLKSDLDTEFIEVYDLSQNEIIEIADNFDIIKSIISSRTERIRPGEYSQVRRDYGFTVTCPANAPIIGVIDTGVNRIDPLKSCITNIAYDLTDTSAYWDENGHGTSVAGLIILGQEFILNIKTVYEAKAKIAIIKALHDNGGEINIIKLLGYIKEARRNHNIKFFNLSINERLHKAYNSTFSNYAYQLDKLTYEEDILIFISVGNISAEVLEELIKQEPHNSHNYPKIFYCLGEESDIHCCETTNICPPSESLNNLSIGAIASNLEDGLTSDITPAEEYPAYYTRKFHYDYEQSIMAISYPKTRKIKI